MLDNLVCPISNLRSDRNVVRTNTFIGTPLLVTFVITGASRIIVPVALDDLLRAMMNGPTSPTARIARAVARLPGLADRPTDKAPRDPRGAHRGVLRAEHRGRVEGSTRVEREVSA